jgi:hypothetical protein
MNTKILDMLKENRTVVENRFEEMIRDSKRTDSKIIDSKKFFFQVVFNYFEDMSTIMINKALKNEIVFYRLLNTSIEKAEYACSKPAREENRQYFK